MQTELTESTIITGVICRRCNETLAPHTIGEHLNADFMAKHHECPTDEIPEDIEIVVDRFGLPNLAIKN